MPDGVREFTRAVAEARERACERAIQGGTCGVLETWDGNNVTFQVSELVPYGHIYVKAD